MAASRDNPSLSRAITTHSKQRERNVVLVEAAVGGGGSTLRDEPKQRLRRRLREIGSEQEKNFGSVTNASETIQNCKNPTSHIDTLIKYIDQNKGNICNNKVTILSKRQLGGYICDWKVGILSVLTHNVQCI